MKTVKELAAEIATALQDSWSIGESSIFCDESDWDSASDEDITALIEKKLSETQIEAIELFTRGYELGNSNNISLPDALESEFGK